jgi:hypothetical protein
MLAFHIAAMATSSTQRWGKWLFLVMTAHALFCIFNAAQRNAVYGEFYRLGFMKRTGSPASRTTAVLAFVIWGSGFVTLLFPRLWEWGYSGYLAIGLFATVMLSSFLDGRAFRAGNDR